MNKRITKSCVRNEWSIYCAKDYRIQDGHKFYMHLLIAGGKFGQSIHYNYDYTYTLLSCNFDNWQYKIFTNLTDAMMVGWINFCTNAGLPLPWFYGQYKHFLEGFTEFTTTSFNQYPHQPKV